MFQHGNKRRNWFYIYYCWSLIAPLWLFLTLSDIYFYTFLESKNNFLCSILIKIIALDWHLIWNSGVGLILGQYSVMFKFGYDGTERLKLPKNASFWINRETNQCCVTYPKISLLRQLGEAIWGGFSIFISKKGIFLPYLSSTLI